MPSNNPKPSAGAQSKPTPAPASAAELSRQAKTEAEARLVRGQEWHQQARDAAEEHRARLTSGQVDPSALEALTVEHLHRSAAVEVAALAVEGYERAVRLAERNLINDDVRLANVLADVLAKMLGGRVPVKVVTVSADVQPNDNGEPVLYLLQKDAAKDKGGILSGELTGTYFRDSLMAPLDPDRLDRACRDRGFQVGVVNQSTSKIGDSHRDTVSLKVRKAFPQLPVLSVAPPEDAILRLARGVTARLADALPSDRPDGIRLIGESRKPGTVSETLPPSIVATEPDDEGAQRMTVAVSSFVRVTDKSGRNVAAILADTMERCVGMAESGTGRIASVDNIRTSWSEPNRPPVGVVVEGYDMRTVWTVSAKVTLTYRLA
ncbi:hypothetical protein ACI8AG_09540 [Blastococcus sp. SYSU DS0552]